MAGFFKTRYLLVPILGVGALVALSFSRARQPGIHPSAIVTPSVSGASDFIALEHAAAVAAKPDEAMQKVVMRAISAATMRDRPRRESALAELRHDPGRAMAAINVAMKQGKNPEYVRQLDMLAKEVRVP